MTALRNTWMSWRDKARIPRPARCSTGRRCTPIACATIFSQSATIRRSRRLRSAPVAGKINGQALRIHRRCTDPRIGPRLEIFAAGQCMWLGLANVASIEMEAPKRLRDLLWAPALVRTGPAFKGTELGEVLMPAICPLSFRHAGRCAVKLGRATVWEEQENGDIDSVWTEDATGGWRRVPVPGVAPPGDCRRRRRSRTTCLCAMIC